MKRTGDRVRGPQRKKWERVMGEKCQQLLKEAQRKKEGSKRQRGRETETERPPPQQMRLPFGAGVTSPSRPQTLSVSHAVSFLAHPPCNPPSLHPHRWPGLLWPGCPTPPNAPYPAWARARAQS